MKTRSAAYYRRWRKKNPEKARAITSRYKKANTKEITTRAAARYRLDPAKAKRAALKSRLKRAYGLTVKQYEVLCAMKPGCWVCEKVTRKDGRPLVLHVEHDHKSGRVRGRACFQCNALIIRRHHDGRVLRAAADYIDSTFDARSIAA